MSARISRIWIEAATEQANLAEVCPSLLLGGCLEHKVVRARWRAFKQVLDANPRMSISRLAQTSGFDHATLLHGLKRLSGVSATSIKFGGTASGRRPMAARSIAEAAE